jgi:SAM-dependent methyltransferase
MKEVLFKKFHREWHAVQSDCTDPVALPYPDAHFETAFSLGVLEHVRENQGGDEVSSLRELYRILKPGGHLFVFHFPNKHSWIEKCVRILNKMRIVTAYSHSFLYTQQTIEHLVGQTNFSLLEMGMYNLFPRRMLRWVPRGIANKKCVFTGVCFAERFVERWLRKFSQNYYFVLKKL